MRPAVPVTSLAAMLALLAASPAQAQSPKPDGAVGQDYVAAREWMQARGYEPEAIRQPGDASGDCVGGDCDRFPEVVACAGTGVAPCLLSFVDGAGKRVILITAGEGLADGAVVTGWRRGTKDDAEEIAALKGE